MSHKHCTVCSAIETNDASETPLNNTELGRTLGTSEASIRRHRQAVGDLGGIDEFFGVPSDAITSRGASIRTADGSWQKITFHPNKVALAETLNYDDMERAIEGFDFTPVTGLRDRYSTTLHAADPQIGKANQRGGGTPGTVARVQNSFNLMAEYLREHKPEHFILSDNGDGIENIFNVSGQRYTNDLDVPAQIRTFRRLMIYGIKLLAPLVPQFTYLAVPSNHGEFRTGYKEQGGNTDADFGLEISHQLEDVFAENPALAQHVQFVRPEPLHQTAVIETSGTKLAYHHGHAASSQAALGKWWQGLDHGRMPGWDADIFVTAHFHNLRLEQSGNGRWLIGVSSSEPSSDWYTNGSGESSVRGMTHFNVRDGAWSDLGIF